MRANLKQLLSEGKSCLQPLLAFTAYNFEGAAGILEAAERAQVSVCLLVSENAFRAADGRYLASMLVALADAAPLPVCVQRDHARNLKVIAEALKLGVSGIMANGSRMPFTDNVAFVKQAVALAGAYAASVEAELGTVTGDEDRATDASAGQMTDPAEAVKLVEATGVTALAVAIGNVHGTYRGTPALDWQHLATLRKQVPTTLTLHGASGLPADHLRRAVHSGIAKININAELRQAYVDELTRALPEISDGWRMAELVRRLCAATAAAATAVLDRFNTGT